ncbi:Baculoviral IAP repeat-containing protein 7-A [Chionoecetes opilio]|uniref:Baculoviral IAP repeat-containing protein 7-A n=1 Tax=Chionoecetes opilio TaxID=41210 RepID=A0A8J5CQC7_CHIOP|nr:Baculoviral IAP repeat-containing protein 7-A [Chionoecetes opilio]
MSDQMVNPHTKRTQPRPYELRRERRFHSLADVMFESVRRQTFTNWTLPYVDADQLARAGFFFLRTHDHVQCAFCRGVVGYWDPGDQPLEEHRRHFSACRFVSGMPTGNVPANHSADDTGRAYRLLEEYHHFRVSSTRPAPNKYHRDATQVDAGGHISYPQFITGDTRKPTFRNWPESVGVTPDSIVAAGFFYTGLSDMVQCFHCGGGLFGWREGDDPAADHAHYYPWCPFIRTVCDSPGGARPWGDNLPPAPVIRPIQLSTHEEDLLLAHPLAKRVVEMGLQPSSVKAGLKAKLEKTGRFCLEVTEALEVVFDYDESRRSAACIVAESSLVRDGVVAMEVAPVPAPQIAAVTEDARRDELKTRKQLLQQEVVDLQRLLEEEKNRLMCRICKSSPVEVVLQPCSHLHFCATCARPLDRCRTCDTAVRGTLRPIIG